MFTGLVEGRGCVVGLHPDGAAVRLVLEFPAEIAPGISIGESIAINGCCLTVVEIVEDHISFEAGEETLSKTSLGQLQPGDFVNLERALPAGGRLGGHFVQGHVDGTGTVSKIERDGEWTVMRFEVPEELSAVMVSKGSVTIDGVSLTLVDVTSTEFSIALIPHTLEVTTLGVRKVGDLVNIETDILGKYVRKFLVT
jgi:riboflavin synthase